MSSRCTTALSTLERVRYFPRQLVTADDMVLEQEYFRQKARRHNRFLHGWGVVCGLQVEAAPTDAQPWLVRVCPGFAVAPQGDDISVPDAVFYDLATGQCTQEPCQPWPCPPSANSGGGGAGGNAGGVIVGGARVQPVWLAVRYAECDSRPVRVHPLGCGCDESLCEYSRIRDDFEVKLLCDLPKSHTDAAAADKAWQTAVAEWLLKREGPMPVPPCPGCPSEPWVVIARVILPQQGVPIAAGHITYDDRRVLLSTTALQGVALMP